MNSKYYFAAFFAAIVSLFPFRAEAQTSAPFNLQVPVSECDFCMCSQGISPLEMSGSAIRFDSRYTELSQMYTNGKLVQNSQNQVERYFTNTVSFTYRFVPNFTASVLVPYSHKNESYIDPGNGPYNQSNIGLGDISLIGRYNLIANHQFGSTQILSVTGGVKFDNGTTSLLYQGAPADPDLQLGTGTTDFMIGMGYLRGFESWSIGANVLGGIRGPGPGAAGHVYGNNINYDVTARYRVYPDDMSEPTIFAALGVRGEWRSAELQDGTPIPSTGGNVVYLTPGVQVFFSPKISLDASYWLPVIHDLTGSQLGETFKFLAGIQYVI